MRVEKVILRNFSKRDSNFKDRASHLIEAEIRLIALKIQECRTQTGNAGFYGIPINYVLRGKNAV